jgi:type II secretory pathway pseudopilin PulG
MKAKFHPAFIAGRRSGFSIIEMLVVLNIMAWMAWASITALWGITGGLAMNRRVSDMQSMLELARTQAMQLNTYVYVGFFESDGSQPSASLPARSGVGKVWVGMVATKDGTPGYNPLDPSSTLSPSNLMPVGRLQQMENLHLNQSLPFSNQSMMSNAVLAGKSSVTAPFGWPINTKATIPGFSSAVIQFTPRGSASVPGSTALPESIQLALLPSKGGLVSINFHDTAVVQIDAVNGIVKSFRPSLP